MATPLHQFEGKYEILEKIAEGGMGAVYKVRHRLLDVIRVIKVMRPQLEQQEGIRARFLREARLAIKMRHPNIAQLDDFSMDDAGNAYIVMEYIDGVTLQDFFERLGTPPVSLALEVACQSLDALSYLHRKSVIHRDISPDNIMLARDEAGNPLAKLIDLGIAKTLQGDGGLTATGMFVGKIRYASPEHFKTGEGQEVDQSSDIYSFGVVLYEMLTGRHPIVGESFSTLIAGHLFRPPLDFATSDPGNRVAPALREIVLRSIMKAPGDRFPTSAEFRDALAALQPAFPLDRVEFERLFRQRGHELPTMRIQRKKGSTQGRLDAEFKDPGAAPALVDMTSSATAVEAVDAHRAERAASVGQAAAAATPTADGGDARATALVAAARHLVDLELYREARLQLDAARQIAPDDVAIAALLGDVTAAETRQAARQAAIEEAEEHLAAGRAAEALAAVTRAIADVGESADLVALRERAEQAVAEELARAVVAVLDEVDRLLAVGDLDLAAVRLADARTLDANAPGLPTRVNAVAAARQQRAEEEQQAARLAELLGEAQRHLDGGDAAAAVERLRAAHELAPDDATVRGRLAAAEETATVRAEEQRLAAVLAAALGRVDGALAKDDFATARGALAGARQELGEGNEELVEADARIERAEARWRAGRIEAVQRAAQSHLAEGAYDRAVREIEKGLELAPDHAGLKAQLADSQAAGERHRRRQAVSSVEREVDRHLGKGRLERADELVAKAVAEIGDDELLAPLRERVAAAWTARRAEETAREQAAAEARRAEETARRAEQEAQRAADEARERARAEAAAAARAKAAMPPPPVVAEAPLPPVPRPPSEDDTAPVPRPERTAKEQRKPGKPAKAAATPPVATAKAAPATAATPVKAKVDLARTAPAKVEVRAAGGVPRWVWAAVGAVVVVAVVAAVVLLRGGEPTPGGATSGLVITARPWGEVVSVVAADGTAVDLGPSPSTPLRLSLAPGRYTVTLAHPDRAEPEVREIEVSASGDASLVVDLVAADVDAFLRRHGVEP